jgi:hypothetical protein
MAKKKVSKAVSETQKKVAALCDKALEKISATILQHYKKHPDSAWTGHNLVDLEKTVKAVYKDMGVSIGKTFKSGLSETMQDAYDKAVEDLKTNGKRNAILGKPNTGLVKQFMDSTFEEIAGRTTMMSHDHIRQLRNLSADVLRTAALTGASRAEITRDMLARASEIPGFKFVGKNGAEWKNKTYFSMLARTELMNANRSAYDQKCAEEGCDVVELDIGGICCDACAKWEGKQFSLTGATKGLPTKQDLIDDGVFHPNCTHSYTAVPDWELPAPEPEEDKGQPEPEPEPQPEPQPEQSGGFPDDPAKLRPVKSLGGSTGAELVEDANGNKYVMKRGGRAGGDAAAHLRNECTADDFYRAAGINVPECKIYETKNGPVKLSRYLEDTTSLDDWWHKASKKEKEEMLEKLRPGFDVDVVTGNWDVVGLSKDNIVIDKDGTPWRIDNGGALGYRAQGAAKKPEEWQAGWPDDLWSMRESANNKAFFGGIDTLDLCNSISNRDWSKALDSLPENERKIVEKRLAEIKQLADRGNDFKQNTKYKPESIETVLKSSYEFSKDGMRERIPHTVDHEGRDYGWFRSPPGSSARSSQKTIAASQDNNIHSKIIEAAKTINFHNGDKSSKSGSGDHSPNQSKIDAALALKPELQKMAANGNDGAKYYLRQLEKIEKAAKNSTTLGGSNVDGSVPVYTAEPQKPQTSVDKDAPRSFTQQVYDKIASESIEYNGKKIQLDPYFIQRAQASQAGNSFNVEACKMKMVRLNAMGIEPDKASKDYFTGHTSSQKTHWREAKEYYKDHPDELARDTATYLRYQSAVQIALENCDLPGKDPATRTIIISRTEKDNVMSKSEVGHEMQAKHGVNESHGAFKTVVVEGDNLTMTRVPYSRISGIFMAEQTPGGRDSGFLGDSENEFTADTSGLKTLFVEKNCHSGRDLEPYRVKYIEWENAGYP